MSNVIDLKTKKKEMTVHDKALTYTLYSMTRGGKVEHLEIVVSDKQGGMTKYYLFAGENAESLFSAVPTIMEKRIRELLD